MSKVFHILVSTAVSSTLLTACGDSKRRSREPNQGVDREASRGQFYLEDDCNPLAENPDVKYDSATRWGFLVEDKVISRIGIQYASPDCEANTIQGWSRYWVYKQRKFSVDHLNENPFDWEIQDSRLLIGRNTRSEVTYPVEPTALEANQEIILKVLDYSEMSDQTYIVRAEIKNLGLGALPSISCFGTFLKNEKPSSEGDIFTFIAGPSPYDDEPRRQDHCSINIGFPQGPDQHTQIIGQSEEFILDFRPEGNRS
ncbi:MAG TPA: hypothetical protein VE954_11230 [Oligoflexus sp.]|uniref:hypothetical protein n=1 Tax=Oligoflexus sp. TaxID=1971216 RepID=UPI002D59770A|nr:hypothetical protein [Oligoflexus sp.]HYX33678.1 hypothetical protein [Oligoflexus sp.]